MIELTPQQAIANLKANPKSFLETYPIQIENKGGSGMPAMEHADVGQKRIWIKKSTNYRPGKYRKKKMYAWYLYSFMHQQPLATDIHGQPIASTDFQAYYVPMAWSDADDVWCQLDNDPVIMITAQLSGCSVVIENQEGGGVRAKHLQPTVGREGGGVTGDALYNTLKDQEGVTVFGKGLVNSDNFIVNIIGVRDRVKGWRIYAQQRNRFADMWKIIKVHNVYP